MRSREYLREDELYYSAIYGGGVYGWDGQFITCPLEGGHRAAPSAPLLTNVLTGERYFAKSARCDAARNAFYHQRILNPPKTECILWPSDMICLSETQAEPFGISVDHVYTGDAPPFEGQKANRALLFSCRDYPRMVDGNVWLGRMERPNWQNPALREMAVQIVQALEGLNRSGYLYGDIHLSRFLFREDGGMILDFSNLLFSFLDVESKDAASLCAPRPGEYPIEFAEPAYVEGTQAAMDFNSQNYSLCALLFYLFFERRYPYDGRLLTGRADSDPQQHYLKFRDYHKMPIFIFDEEDRQNELGAFDEEQQIIDLWAQCPQALKELFLDTLCTKNARRQGGDGSPPPIVWLRYFQELGWLPRGGEGPSAERK